MGQLNHDIFPVAGDDKGHLEVMNGALDGVVHNFGRSRIESSRWLICQEDHGRLGELACQNDALLFSTG